MKITDEELRKKLNLNVMELLDNTPTMGLFDLPCMYCPNITDIDYIALYTEPGLYRKNPKTLIKQMFVIMMKSMKKLNISNKFIQL